MYYSYTYIYIYTDMFKCLWCFASWRIVSDIILYDAFPLHASLKMSFPLMLFLSDTSLLMCFTLILPLHTHPFICYSFSCFPFKSTPSNDLSLSCFAFWCIPSEVIPSDAFPSYAPLQLFTPTDTSLHTHSFRCHSLLCFPFRGFPFLQTHPLW